MVSIFKDVFKVDEAYYIPIEEALDRIKRGVSKDKVLAIRQAKLDNNSKLYKKLKLELPSVIFSGEAKTVIEKTKQKDGAKYNSLREDASITTHSGFMVLDFDEIETSALLEARRSQLTADSFIFAYWDSPSSVLGGYGLKGLVRIPPSITNHAKLYESFIERYPDLDTTSRSLSRLCFESYDPDIYINKKSKVWTKIITPELKEEVKKRTNTDFSKINVARNMIMNAADGEKHNVLLKAANLLGGYVNIGRVDRDEATKALEEEISLRSPDNMESAKKAIQDGLNHGESQPINEAKKIERIYKKRSLTESITT